MLTNSIGILLRGVQKITNHQYVHGTGRPTASDACVYQRRDQRRSQTRSLSLVEERINAPLELAYADRAKTVAAVPIAHIRARAAPCLNQPGQPQFTIDRCHCHRRDASLACQFTHRGQPLPWRKVSQRDPEFDDATQLRVQGNGQGAVERAREARQNFVLLHVRSRFSTGCKRTGGLCGRHVRGGPLRLFQLC